MDAKVEHLKMIQAVVTRMAGNSFLLRGWTVTLVAALFAFGAKDADRVFVVIAWVPLLVFAGLDAYYLTLERRYRDLYQEVAASPAEPTDFSLSVAPYQAGRQWRHSLVSRTVVGFYLPLAGLLVLLTVWLFISAKPPAVPANNTKSVTITFQ